MGSRAKTWMQTYSGIAFRATEPSEKDINIKDIAHSLACSVRFNGHTNVPYSIAQHSVHVASLVPKEHKLTALLHDATEAYVGDVVRPIKRQLPQFKEYEDKVWKAIANVFNLPYELPKCVIEADCIALVTERRDLMGTPPEAWDPYLEQFEPDLKQIEPLDWKESKRLFLDNFKSFYENKKEGKNG